MMAAACICSLSPMARSGGGLITASKASAKPYHWVVYPVTGLADARRKAEDARKQISNGTDRSNTRKESKVDKQLAAENANSVNAGLPILNSFEHIDRDWLASIAHAVQDITHQKKISRLELHVFPVIGSMGINEIKSPDIFSLVKPLFNKLETAHRVHAEISSVFSYAIAHGLKDYDPARAVGPQYRPKK